MSFRAILLLVLFIVAHAGSALGAGGTTQKLATRPGVPVGIEFVQFFASNPPSGWIPVVLRIRNDSTEALTWIATFDSNFYGGSSRLGEWVLDVPAGETREFSLFIPQPWIESSGGYGAIQGTLNGPALLDNNLPLGPIAHMPTNRTAFTGMSQTLAPTNWGPLENKLNPSSGTRPGPRSGGVQLVGSPFEIATIPADWRSFSGFETIWLHRTEWVDLTAAHRLALLRWVFQGGRLYIAGAGAGLEGIPELESSRSMDGGTWQSGQHGFGTVTRVPLESVGPAIGLNIDDVAEAIRMRRGDSTALGALGNDIAPTDVETDVGEVRPGGVFLGLLVAAIAVLLGPVNVFVLAPAKRRARLFVTVPIIALGGALALVLLILVQDGTGGHGRRGTLIALLPDRPEALLLQEQCALTGLLLGRGFSLAEDMTMVDYTRDTSMQFGTSNQRRPRGGLDRRGGDLSGAWFTSRAVQSHHLRGFVPTRATLTLEVGADDTHTVLSTCPGTLRDVVVFSGNGLKWTAAEVPQGRKVPLVPATDVRDSWRNQLRTFGVSLSAAAGTGDGRLTFRATAERWDDSVPLATVSSIRWRNDAIFVTGPVREAKP